MISHNTGASWTRNATQVSPFWGWVRLWHTERNKELIKGVDFLLPPTLPTMASTAWQGSLRSIIWHFNSMDQIWSVRDLLMKQESQFPLSTVSIVSTWKQTPFQNTTEDPGLQAVHSTQDKNQKPSILIQYANDTEITKKATWRKQILFSLFFVRKMQGLKSLVPVH